MAGGTHAKRRDTSSRRVRLPSVTWGLAAGITVFAVAWGYLVLLAIDFGTSARTGGSSWWFLALASVGAVACLFAGLMLLAQLLTRLGIMPESGQQRADRPPGGRRVKR